MKKIIYPFFVALVLVSCTSRPHYVVKGKIRGSDSVMFYLQKRDDGKTVTIDSAVSRKGSFIMKGGSIDHPQLVQLVAGKTRNRAAFYLENSDIEITGNLDSLSFAKVTGSKTQDEYNAFIESNKPLSEAYSRIYQEYQVARRANNTQMLAELEKSADSIQNEMTEVQKNFVRNNPSSYITPAILGSLSYEVEPDELDSMIGGLDTTIADLPQIRSIKERLAAMKVVAIGQKAPDFTMDDPEGKPVSLSSLVGKSKLLLIDFWAGWCNPCRQENPNVVKVYNEFHKKGLDILGVSLDRTREEWVKAIAQDKLTWTEVSDLKYWGNAAAKLYAVNSIPANFLLNSEGIIIAKNLRGEELSKKVREELEK